ncbi:MAG: enoyl-CoA hydratase-related protein [Aeromicrobium erythreum]
MDGSTTVDRSALARRLYAALAAGDAAALGDVLHPDFTGSATAGLPRGLGGDYDSADAMRTDFWWRIGRTWAAAAEPDEMLLLEDGRLLVRGTYRGHERSTGAPLEAVFSHVLTIRDDRVLRLEQLTDSGAWAATLPDQGTIDLRVDDDGVAHLRLDRPHVRNAIDQALADDTLAAARRIQRDPSVRAVLITGAGEHFTVGGDISTFVETDPDDLADLLRDMTTPFHEAFRVLADLDVPVVTATRGSVAGGGIGYVYASDVSIASETSVFVTAFSRIGLSGDGGWSWHLPRRVGLARAAAITLLNRPVPAAEAGAIGLVSDVVPDDVLDETALEVARSLARGPTRAYGRMRRLLRDTWDRSLADQLRAETEHLHACGGTRDAQVAIRDFVAKRPTEFEGH